MCTKLRSGVIVGLWHRRQAVKCPRAPFSWKPSAESDMKSAMVRRRLVYSEVSYFLIRWYVLSPVARKATESQQ